MRKLTLLATALLLIGAAASGQNQPKKKGGFWNKLKKGIESTTGLDVSKETLFVYPQIGDWKMELVEATGDSRTGEVTVRIGIMPLAGQTAAFLELTGVVGDGGRALPAGKAWKEHSKFRTSDLDASPLYRNDLAAGTYGEYCLQTILAPVGMKSFKSLAFTLETGNAQEKGFEARDVAITWIDPTAGNAANE